jgi:hypothetical protein
MVSTARSPSRAPRASIMAGCPSVKLNATVTMMTEKLADVVRRE